MSTLDILGLSLEQLRSASKGEIAAMLASAIDSASRKEVLEQLSGVETICDPPERTFGNDGQITSYKETERNVLGEIVGGRSITWKYYKSGEVDTIEIVDLKPDLETVAKQRSIKHFCDGQRPITTIQKRSSG
jgi:hypothetical protein